jgi:hypothetical protein
MRPLRLLRHEQEHSEQAHAGAHWGEEFPVRALRLPRHEERQHDEPPFASHQRDAVHLRPVRLQMRFAGHSDTAPGRARRNVASFTPCCECCVRRARACGSTPQQTIHFLRRPRAHRRQPTSVGPSSLRTVGSVGVSPHRRLRFSAHDVIASRATEAACTTTCTRTLSKSR